jgi:LytS/YehU family sensor histidine kinase
MTCSRATSRLTCARKAPDPETRSNLESLRAYLDIQQVHFGDRLTIEIRVGMGVAGGATVQTPVGLANTRARLERLYPDRATLTAEQVA